MTDTSNRIEIDSLVKDFRVYHRTYGSVKSLMAAVAKNLVAGQRRAGYETRRVLDNISFNVRSGEAVGLVGRNGSGKSTLLSILSRVYLPTSGEIRLRGKVLGLLELGYSFDPELTGFENIFINGVILGLSEQQVAARIESIIAFSELDQNAIASPVRMYSSGMQLRLGISIALHLDAEIILIDEGLVVADHAFQHKCLSRLEEFKREGRTIIMVSHILPHVERLSDKVVWLDRGRIRAEGSAQEVLAMYRQEMDRTA